MTRCEYILIAAILAVFGTANADVYKYIDEDGNVVFTDEPAADADVELVELPPYDPPSTPSPVGRVRHNRQIDRSEEQIEAERIDKLAQEQVTDHARRCTEARVALQVLHQGMPVYQVRDGTYRAAWAGDNYEGYRDYLGDAQRDAAINAELRKLGLNCVDPLNEEEQDQAAIKWYNEEHCAGARKDLEALLNPRSRASDQSVEEGWETVDRYCGD